jgi:hypothetical protein
LIRNPGAKINRRFSLQEDADLLALLETEHLCGRLIFALRVRRIFIEAEHIEQMATTGAKFTGDLP